VPFAERTLGWPAESSSSGITKGFYHRYEEDVRLMKDLGAHREDLSDRFGHFFTLNEFRTFTDTGYPGLDVKTGAGVASEDEIVVTCVIGPEALYSGPKIGSPSGGRPRSS